MEARLHSPSPSNSKRESLCIPQLLWPQLSRGHIFIIIILIIIIDVRCIYGHMCCDTHVTVRALLDGIRPLLLPFWGAEDQTQVTRLAQQALYPPDPMSTFLQALSWRH